MVKTILFNGKSYLIALIGATEQDLGNIGRRFYDEFRTPERCPYATLSQAAQLQMVMTSKETPSTPRPCRIHAVNGGNHLPKGVVPNDPHRHRLNNYSSNLFAERGRKPKQRNLYYYDFAIVGECSDMDYCMDAFLRLMGLRDVENSSSYMSKDELGSFME